MTQDGVRVPPQSADAEQSVLGAILLDPASIHRAMEILTPEDFYRPAHAIIFRALMSLADRGEHGDMLLLKEELQNQGKLEEAGGAASMASLVDSLPTASNLHHYARIVKEKALLRRLLHASQEIAEQIFSSTDTPEDLLDWAEQQVFSVTSQTVKSDFHNLGDLLKDAMKEIDQLYQKGSLITGLETGFIELDRLTAGLQNGDLIIVAARPSMGKTSLVLNIAQHVAVNQKVPVAVFSLEMSRIQLTMRMLASEARIPLNLIRTGKFPKRDFSFLIQACDRLSVAPIIVDDSSAMSVLEIRAKARRLKSEGRLGLLIIDYLQLMGGSRRAENRQQEISEISRSLKALAKELEVPVIAVSQLSRAVESRRPPRPMLADLRESGAIEQDGDLIIFIYREEAYEPDTDKKGIAELIIGKQRNGPTGNIETAFNKSFTRFENLADASRLPPPEDLVEEGEG